MTLVLAARLASGCEYTEIAMDLVDYVWEPSYTDVRSVRVVLIGSIESYRSHVEIAEVLTRAGLILKEKLDPGPADVRPPFNFRTLTVQGYRDLGSVGELQLRFFNDRLMHASFEPGVSHDAYLEALGRRLGVLIPDATSIKCRSWLRVHSFRVKDTGRRYIKFSDIRLEREVNSWIRRYS